jgi:hypothetical protein
MKLPFLSLFLILFTQFIAVFGVMGAEKPILLDFSHSHNLDDVLNAGLKVTEDTWPNSKRRTFLIVNHQNVLVRLPGGLELQQRIDYGGSMNAERNGQLVTLSLEGQILPEEEAYHVALKAHLALNIPVDRLEKWRKSIQGKIGSRADSYSNGSDYYPEYTLEVQHSMSRPYPWMVCFNMGWNVSSDAKNRDEKWGVAHNPKPPVGLEHISLDSPSGKTYDRADEFREGNARQEALNKKRGIEVDAEGNVVPSKAPKAALNGKLEADTPQHQSYWYLWLLLILAALASIFSLMRKPSR